MIGLIHIGALICAAFSLVYLGVAAASTATYAQRSWALRNAALTASTGITLYAFATTWSYL